MRTSLQTSLIFFISLVFLSSCSSILHPPKKTFERAVTSKPFDVIIVPGIPYNGEQKSSIMKIRLQWAKMLIDSGYTKNIIFSGSAVYTPYIESEVMAEHAVAMGIPKDKILIERNAEHSTENTYFGYRLAKENGHDNIALATDPVQLKHLRKFINYHELPVDMLPIVFPKLVRSERIDTAINCDHLKIANFESIKDRENLITRFKGTLGKQIIWHEEDVRKSKILRKLYAKNRIIPTQRRDELGMR